MEGPIEPRSVFLTAEWRHLAMLNYDIDPAILAPMVPVGTELDLYDGRAIVSLVGFLFLNTRVMGVPILFHRNFEEVNLRFYVRRKADDGWRRGVVFIKELVPRLAIAAVARAAYGENYIAVPMNHEIAPQRVSYGWRFKGAPYSIRITVQGEPAETEPGSEAEFITEHYWGYTRRRDGRTTEYQVTHPRWRAWSADSAQFTGNAQALYGDKYAAALRASPRSAFLAEGSEVSVHRGLHLP